MTKLDPKTKRIVTDDWRHAFPDMGVYKPMRLLRRCGPLLTGICLYRDAANESYLPIAHLHCLGAPFDSITLSMAQRLQRPRSGSEYWIKGKWHENHWKEAAELLKKQSLLPLTGAVSLEQVSAAFREAPRRSDMTEEHSPLVFRDWLLTLSWAGRLDEAQLVLAQAEHEIARWPSHFMDREGGLDSWLRKMDEIAHDSDSTRRIVEQEVSRHQVQNLPAMDVSSWLA